MVNGGRERLLTSAERRAAIVDPVAERALVRQNFDVYCPMVGKRVSHARRWPGQQVRLAGGTFDGLVASILELDEKDRLVVLLELLRRPVKVKVDARWVAPA